MSAANKGPESNGEAEREAGTNKQIRKETEMVTRLQDVTSKERAVSWGEALEHSGKNGWGEKMFLWDYTLNFSVEFLFYLLLLETRIRFQSFPPIVFFIPLTLCDSEGSPRTFSSSEDFKPLKPRQKAGIFFFFF